MQAWTFQGKKGIAITEGTKDLALEMWPKHGNSSHSGVLREGEA